MTPADLEALLSKLRDPVYDNDVLHRYEAANAITDLRAEVAQLEQHKRWRDETMGTHYADCWREHYDCAMSRIAELERERDALKQDAERYRVLSPQMGKFWGYFDYTGDLIPCPSIPGFIDAWCDARIAARSKP